VSSWLSRATGLLPRKGQVASTNRLTMFLVPLLLALSVLAPRKVYSDGTDPDIVGCLRVDSSEGESYFSIVAQEYKNQDYVTEVRFVVRAPRASRQIRAYHSPDHLLSMFILNATQYQLVTLWEGGSHVGLRIFSLKKNSVEVLFDRQVEFPPEFFWDGILLNEGKEFRGDTYHPQRTEIYVWQTNRFKLAATVPWEERYKALADIRSK